MNPFSAHLLNRLRALLCEIVNSVSTSRLVMASL